MTIAIAPASAVETTSEKAVTLVLRPAKPVQKKRRTRKRQTFGGMTYDEAVTFATTNQPPQKWFDADLSGLRRPR